MSTGGSGGRARVPARPWPALAVASVSISSVSLVLAVSTWAGWVFLRPSLLPPHPEFPAADAGLVYLVSLVLGGLWFAVLPAGVLGVVYGVLAGGRGGWSSVPLARTGTCLGLLSLVTALCGAVVFTVDVSDWGPRWVGEVN